MCFNGSDRAEHEYYDGPSMLLHLGRMSLIVHVTSLQDYLEDIGYNVELNVKCNNTSNNVGAQIK